MKLYGYYHSSAAFRVRIALNLKGLAYDSAPVHLLRGGGEQLTAEFAALNPQKLVPVLIDAGRPLTQSLAIIEYLDETHPQPPLLPSAPEARARVRGLALAVACDIHPLNNLRVLRYLKRELEIGDDGRDGWTRHWIALGLGAIEKLLDADEATATFCHGEAPTIADICLVPQIFNAKRVDCDLEPYPTVMRVFDACMTLDAFAQARPESQPDAPD
jgi:maleylpyruvate isomerase